MLQEAWTTQLLIGFWSAQNKARVRVKEMPKRVLLKKSYLLLPFWGTMSGALCGRAPSLSGWRWAQQRWVNAYNFAEAEGGKLLVSHGWNSNPDSGWRKLICAADAVQQPAGGSTAERTDVQSDPQHYQRASDAQVPLFRSFKSHMLSLSRDRSPPSNALLTTPPHTHTK